MSKKNKNNNRSITLNKTEDNTVISTISFYKLIFSIKKNFKAKCNK